MDQQINEQSAQQDIGGVAKPKSRLSVGAYVMCGWPLLLVGFGGAIGGALGGGAFRLNLAIYKSNMPVPAKVALNILAGLAAFVIWFFIAVAINSAVKK
jgi:hypothetical protein